MNKTLSHSLRADNNIIENGSKKRHTLMIGRKLDSDTRGGKKMTSVAYIDELD